MKPLDMVITPCHWQWRGGDEVDSMNEERKDKRSLSGRVFERRRMGKERGEREENIFTNKGLFGYSWKLKTETEN